MPATYPFTPSSAANNLLAQSGTALLIGLCLDQQVRTEKAFCGPYELRERLGYLDAKKIARLPLSRLQSIFRKPPALHRYPSMMAQRVRALCEVITKQYGGDGTRVWAGVTDVDELHRRLSSLPGFGQGKAAAGIYVLAKYGKKKLTGWQRYCSDEDAPWAFKAGKKLA